MRGSIRTFGGLLMLVGCAGGFDNATDAQLFPLVVIAAIAALVAYSGVTAMNNPTARRGM